MTEEEARQKWCPFTRVGYGGGDMSSATPNRIAVGGVEGLNDANLCIGSACMSWRWREIPPDITYQARGRLSGITTNRTFWYEPTDKPSFLNDEWKWDGHRGCWTVETVGLEDGHCGLAGAAQ